MHRSSLPVEGLDEIRIVERLALDTLPGKDRVVSRTKATQAEMSSLIAYGLTIMIDATSHARFGYGNYDRVCERLALAVDDDSVSHAAIRAGDQIESHRPAIHRNACIIHVASTA